MERKLIDYLPYAVREFKEFQGITTGEQPEFELVWDAADRVMANQFIDTMDDLGLSRWEKMLKIIPEPTDTLDGRRLRIKFKLNATIPYTMPRLRELMEGIAEGSPYSVEVPKNTYILEIVLNWKNPGQILTLDELLAYMPPENLFIHSRNEMVYDGLTTNFFLAPGIKTVEKIGVTDAGDMAVDVETGLFLPTGIVTTQQFKITDTGDLTVEQTGTAFIANALKNVLKLTISDTGKDDFNASGTAYISGATAQITKIGLSDAGTVSSGASGVVHIGANVKSVEKYAVSDAGNETFAPASSVPLYGVAVCVERIVITDSANAVFSIPCDLFIPHGVTNIQAFKISEQ